ncbi:growth/differentiation factor 8-like [Glandiceps talaboti]
MKPNIVICLLAMVLFLYLVESKHSADNLNYSYNHTHYNSKEVANDTNNAEYDKNLNKPPFNDSDSTEDDTSNKDTDNLCPMCMAREVLKGYRLEAIKKKILESLGMKRPPNITRPLPKIPVLQDLIGTVQLQMDDPRPVYTDSTCTAERLITFASKLPSITGKSDTGGALERSCCYFEFSPDIMDHIIHRAHLWVYIQPSKVVQDTVTMLHINQIWSKDKKSRLGEIVRKKKIRLTSGHWESFDFKNIVLEWFTDPELNWGITVEAKDHNDKSVVVTDTSPDEDKKPFIEIMVQPQKMRKKRETTGLECEENSKEERCCRYPISVDFEKFGWDWIIAPKVYRANYCAGKCPANFLTQYPHTQLVEQLDPSATAGPCCTPTKMSSISMLYFNDSENIIFGELPEMVVDACGCS